MSKLAQTVANVYLSPTTIRYLDHPRVEQEDHYYSVVHTALPALGLKPHLLTDSGLESMTAVVERHRDRVDPSALLPTVRWSAAADTVR